MAVAKRGTYLCRTGELLEPLCCRKHSLTTTVDVRALTSLQDNAGLSSQLFSTFVSDGSCP